MSNYLNDAYQEALDAMAQEEYDADELHSQNMLDDTEQLIGEVAATLDGYNCEDAIAILSITYAANIFSLVFHHTFEELTHCAISIGKSDEFISAATEIAHMLINFITTCEEGTQASELSIGINAVLAALEEDTEWSNLIIGKQDIGTLEEYVIELYLADLDSYKRLVAQNV